jgi:hypothetical protein
VEQAMISNILLVVFTIAIILNAFALFRYWQALRIFNIMMSSLETTQREFNELVKNKRETP